MLLHVRAFVLFLKFRFTGVYNSLQPAKLHFFSTMSYLLGRRCHVSVNRQRHFGLWLKTIFFFGVGYRLEYAT